MIDVVIPTLGKPHAFTAIASLRYLPFPIKLHLIRDGKSWAEAINIGLAESKNDVLIMDDDIEILPETFNDFEKVYDLADIFGFKLLFRNKTIQHGGGLITRTFMGHAHYGEPSANSESRYCPHVTASLMYIKRRVLDKIGEMTVMPGAQFEDVDFSFRAIKEGFKIYYIANPAYHDESATKKDDPDFAKKMNQNLLLLSQKFYQDTDLWDRIDKICV